MTITIIFCGILQNKGKESIDSEVDEFDGGFALILLLRLEDVDEAFQLFLLALPVADVQLVHSIPPSMQQRLQSQSCEAVVSCIA